MSMKDICRECQIDMNCIEIDYDTHPPIEYVDTAEFGKYDDRIYQQLNSCTKKINKFHMYRGTISD